MLAFCSDATLAMNTDIYIYSDATITPVGSMQVVRVYPCRYFSCTCEFYALCIIVGRLLTLSSSWIADWGLPGNGMLLLYAIISAAGIYSHKVCCHYVLRTDFGCYGQSVLPTEAPDHNTTVTSQYNQGPGGWVTVSSGVQRVGIRLTVQ